MSREELLTALSELHAFEWNGIRMSSDSLVVIGKGKWMILEQAYANHIFDLMLTAIASEV